MIRFTGDEANQGSARIISKGRLHRRQDRRQDRRQKGSRKNDAQAANRPRKAGGCRQVEQEKAGLDSRPQKQNAPRFRLGAFLFAWSTRRIRPGVSCQAGYHISAPVRKPGPPGTGGYPAGVEERRSRTIALLALFHHRSTQWCTISIVLFQLAASFDLIQNSLGDGLNHRAESVGLPRTQSRNNLQK